MSRHLNPVVEDWHVGRHFNGAGSIEESCPCPQLACGLVDSLKANEIDCPQHAIWSAKTIRSGHPADECPERPIPNVPSWAQ